MLSQKFVKFIRPARAIHYTRNSAHRRCILPSCVCNHPSFRSDITAVKPVCGGRLPDHKIRFYSTPRFVDKVQKNEKDEPRPSDIKSSKTHTAGKNIETKLLTKEEVLEKPSDIKSSKRHNLSKKFETIPLTEEEVLEKHIATLSSDIYAKHRVYKNDFLRVLAKVKEHNFSTKKQGLLLLHCCTDLMPDEPLASRMVLAEQVWNTIQLHTKFEVDHYNELLRVYIANKRTVRAGVFIQAMLPCRPDTTTYELLLRAIGEAGDLNQATEVIANMKAMNLPATEDIFNSLIICQGRAGNPQNIQDVLNMMKSLKIKPSQETYTAVARALAWNKQPEKILEELGHAHGSGMMFEEKHIMEIVKTMAECGLHDITSKVLRFLPEKTLQSPSISPYMQAVTTHLVFNNHPVTALTIYNCLPLPSFGPKDDQGLHGRSLIRDCVKAALPSNVIALLTQNLMASGRNPIAIQNAAEAALQLGKTPLALDMFQRMKQLGMPIRCHYFWPILLASTKCYGEKGIMNTLQTMVQMEVVPDYDTMMQYVFPYVSFTSPQNLMKKFIEAGLTASMVLTPMMEMLINSGQVRAASEICELFQGKIDAEKLVKPLVKGYQISMDLKSTVHILEDMTNKAKDKTKDWVGRFLYQYMNQKKAFEPNDFLTIIREIKKRNLKISTTIADHSLNRIPDTCPPEKLEEFRDLLIGLTDEKLCDEGDLFTASMPHPKHMNEESLKAHLNELEAKGMNTRGVLRKLLQEYCRSGNLTAAREIVDKCHKEGVFLSAGMKAAIFDLHVKMGELEQAELILGDLNKTAPNFLLDEFKVIDFATLMVYKRRIDKAFDLINEQSKRRNVIGGRNISMNCWRLLDAVSANNSHVETRNMFELLTNLRYCQPTNVILGPLIRVHLKVENIVEAVNEFVRIANKYNRTPLKHELLCNILQCMSDGVSEENFLTNERCNGKLNKLAQTVLSIDKKVHGAGDVQLTLIAALADVGYKKTLRKMFLDPTVKFHPDALLRHCERFADEKKINALETIAECARDLRHLDVADVYDLILDVYQRDDDVTKAVELWTKMQELNVTPSQKFVRTLTSMAKANNKPIPPEIVALIDKQQKAASS